MLNEGQAKAVNSDAKQILCLAGAGTGKALLNGTGVFTPSGYKPIETLSVGDLVFASNGLAYPVTGVYPQGKKRVYEVIFNNKVSIKCSIDHLWFYQTASQRGHKKGFKVGSLKEISKYPIRLKSGKFYKNNIYIPLTKPLQFDVNEELPLDPYLLGYLIANGCMANNYSLTVSTIHKDVLSYITECVKKYDCRITTIEPDLTYGIRGNTQNYNQIINILRSLNLMEHTASTKFIPKQYLYTSVQNRLSLLQGLFDGDGCNIKNANEYSTSSSQLAQDIQFLCETLGMTVTTSTKNPKYTYKGEKKSGLTSYRLMIKTTKEMINIFRGSHHINRLKKQQCYARKYIKSIKDLGYESEMTCISVASPDESFLTEHCIVTHNTHCMISRISRLVDEGVDVSNMLVLTFTNAAAREMKERYIKLHPGTTTPKFCTFHAFCYSLIARDSNIRLSTGYKSNVIPNIPSDEELRKIETMCKKQCGVKMSDEKLKGKQPLTKQEQFFYDIYWKHYNKLMRMNNYITFDIMCNDVCRLFNENSPYVDTYKRQYTYIFVDEFQDTDPLQWKFVSSFKDANKFVVGDAKQCQPAGTIITMLDGTKKPIENLEVGDYVLSYNIREEYFPKSPKVGYGKRVIKIAKSETDSIYEVHAGDYKTKYTPNHITYARIHYNGNEDKYVVYLMCNENGWWRVGSTKLFAYKNKADFGPCCRLRTEKGSAVWILDVVDSSKKAWLIEQIVAYKFGIPQTTWVHKNTSFGLDELTEVYYQLGDLEKSAIDCLNYYGRDINYPFYTRYGKSHFSKEHIFEIYACNLIKGVMDVAIPYQGEDKKWKLHYHLISDVILDKSNTVVYSLDVEQNHNYVADDILTHNSIYQFRGADSSIIKSLAESDDWETIKLSQNYRSTKPICDFSNEIHKTWAGAAYNLAINSDKPGCNVVIKDEFQFEGKDAVSQLFTMFDLTASETSYALLCRTNAEVAQVKNLLQQANISFRTNNDGKYVAGILKSAVDSTYMVNWLSGKLSSSEYNNYIRLCACDPYYETEEGFMSEYGQRVTRYSQDIFAVRTILDSDTFPQQKCIDIGKILHLPSTVIELEDQTNAAVVDYLLKEIESSRVEANIYVGTIHSVKGLEFDIVHLLGVNGKSFPLTKEAQLNLYYVGCTRAKHELYVWMSNCV